jgi:DNA-binding XRE family transcriptional regulator
MTTIQMIKLPTGEEAVTMSRADYEDLVDSRDHALAMRDVASGGMPMIADADMDAYLAAPTPLAFWRKHRGMTQTQLAEAAEVSQPYIAQLEAGAKHGAAAAVYARLARCLGVRIDDLIEE